MKSSGLATGVISGIAIGVATLALLSICISIYLYQVLQGRTAKPAEVDAEKSQKYQLAAEDVALELHEGRKQTMSTISSIESASELKLDPPDMVAGEVPAIFIRHASLTNSEISTERLSVPQRDAQRSAGTVPNIRLARAKLPETDVEDMDGSTLSDGKQLRWYRRALSLRCDAHM